MADRDSFEPTKGNGVINRSSGRQQQVDAERSVDEKRSESSASSSSKKQKRKVMADASGKTDGVVEDIVFLEEYQGDIPPKRSKPSSSNKNRVGATIDDHIGQGDGLGQATAIDLGETSTSTSAVEPKGGAELSGTELVLAQIEKLRERFPKANLDAWFYRLEMSADPVAETARIEAEFRDRWDNGSDFSSGDDEMDHNGASPKANVAIAQAKHICENFPEASYDECHRRLMSSNNINAETQKIVDELSKNEADPTGTGATQLATESPTGPPCDGMPRLKRQKTELLDVQPKAKGNGGTGASGVTNETAEPNLLPSVKASDSLQSDILWIQVQTLRERFPDKDPNAWYARLERSDDILKETDKIIGELDEGRKAEASGGGFDAKWEEEKALIAAVVDDPEIEMKHPIDAVVALVERIRGVIPGVSFEMCLRRLIRCDSLESEAQNIVNELSVPAQYEEIAELAADDQPGPSNRIASPSFSFPDFLQNGERGAVEQIFQMFPDCDPYHVVKQIAEGGMRAEVLIDRMTTGSYPKLKDRLAKARQERRRQEFMDPDRFQTEEFLKIFLEPEAYFSNTQRMVSELYRHHAFTQLQNDFRNIDVTFLRNRLEEHNNHYLPAWRAVREDVANSPVIGRGRKKGSKIKVPYLSHPREQHVPFPDEVDEQFYRELQYAIYQERIKEFIENRIETRQRRVAQARSQNQLAECPCCYADDVLPEEFIGCSNTGSRHQFCQSCVQRHAEELIGQGRHRVTCLSEDCGQDVPLATLRRILQPRLIDLILRRSQQEEVRRAGVDNMETCPFCDFAIIMDVAVNDDRIFRCQNPECLKESCRLCKEPNHVPLKCNEVEKADETAMRTFVENRMAEAMIRTCPKCNRRIIKEDGCNKMFCPCGVYLCYVCRKELDKLNPYAHFKEQAGAKKGSQCSLYAQLREVHDDVAKEAGEKAREEYLAKHPEFRDGGMKTVDVKTLVEQSKDTSPYGAPGVLHRLDHGGMMIRVGLVGRLHVPGEDLEERRAQIILQRAALQRARMELKEERSARIRETIDDVIRRRQRGMDEDVADWVVEEVAAGEAFDEGPRVRAAMEEDWDVVLERRRRSHVDQIPRDRTLTHRIPPRRMAGDGRRDVDTMTTSYYTYKKKCVPPPARLTSDDDDDFTYQPGGPIMTRSQTAKRKEEKKKDEGLKSLFDGGREAKGNEERWRTVRDRDSKADARRALENTAVRVDFRNDIPPTNRAEERGESSHAITEGGGATAGGGDDDNDDDKEVTKRTIKSWRKMVRDMNTELIKARQHYIRQGDGAFGERERARYVRDAMKARDAAYERLHTLREQALKAGMTAEELDSSDDERLKATELTEEDTAEMVEQAEKMIRENRARREEEATRKAEKFSIVERALMSIQYHAGVLDNPAVMDDHLRDTVANLRETVLRPMNEIEPANAMLGYAENVFNEAERALANRATASMVVPLQEHTRELRAALRAVEGEMRRMLDDARGENWEPATTPGSQSRPRARMSVPGPVYFTGRPFPCHQPFRYFPAPPCLFKTRVLPGIPAGEFFARPPTRRPDVLERRNDPGVSTVTRQDPAKKSEADATTPKKDDAVLRMWTQSMLDAESSKAPAAAASKKEGPPKARKTLVRENPTLVEREGAAAAGDLRSSGMIMEAINAFTRQEEMLVEQQRQAEAQLARVREQIRLLRDAYERAVTRERQEPTQKKQAAKSIASDFESVTRTVVRELDELRAAVGRFSDDAIGKDAGTRDEAPETVAEPRKASEDTPEMARQRLQLMERVERLRERIQRYRLSFASRRMPERVADQILMVQRQMARLYDRLDQRNNAGEPLTEARLAELRQMVEYYEKMTVLEIETAKVDDYPQLRRRYPAPAKPVAGEGRNAKETEASAAAVDSDDDDVQVIRISPGPEIEWESTSVKQNRERSANDGDATISVVPKYAKKEEMGSQDKVDDRAEAAAVDELFGDGAGDSLVIPKRLGSRTPRGKSTNSTVDLEMEDILRQDDPLQILSAVGGDQPCTSTAAPSKSDGDAVRDMLVALQASMTDLFGGGGCSPQRQHSISGMVQQPQVAVLSSPGTPHAQQQQLQTPQQQQAISSPQNFVQINVNVQPTAAFGLHLQQQPAPVTAPAPAPADQQQQESEDDKREEASEKDLMWW